MAQDELLALEAPLPGWATVSAVELRPGAASEVELEVNTVSSVFQLSYDIDLRRELELFTSLAEATGWTQLVADCTGLDRVGTPGVRLTGRKAMDGFDARLRVSIVRFEDTSEVIASVDIVSDLVSVARRSAERDRDVSCLTA